MSPRRRLLLVFCVLCSLCTAFSPPIMTDGDVPVRTLTPDQLRDLQPPDKKPQITAAAAMVLNLNTGQIVYSLHPHERRAPASLTKMVTALVAVEDYATKNEMEAREMRVRQSDVAWTYSAVHISNGEPLNMWQLMNMLLIASDNVAANVLARELAGDRATFVEWMNQRVQEMGLQNTRFGNPSGLDHEATYSTAYELAIIARAFISDPVLLDIVNTTEATAAGHPIQSTNELLGVYPGMVGVKTGTTDNAGECLITLVQRPEGEVMSVVLGSEERFKDTRRLLDYYYDNYAELRIALPPSDQNRYLDRDGNWHELAMDSEQVVLIRPWQVGSDTAYRYITMRRSDPQPDETVGILAVQLAGEPLMEVSLYAR